MPLGNIEKHGWKYGSNKTVKAILLGGLKGMDLWAKLVAQRASTSEKRPFKTGHLARNIRAGKATVHPIAKFSALVGTGAEVPYTRAHEMGSGLFAEFGERKKIRIWAGKLNPGQTKSLNPKWALSFKWPGGPDPHPALQTAGPYAGYYTFAYVDHPGVKASRFLEGAVKDSVEEGRGIMLTAINAALRARSASS